MIYAKEEVYELMSKNFIDYCTILDKCDIFILRLLINDAYNMIKNDTNYKTYYNDILDIFNDYQKKKKHKIILHNYLKNKNTAYNIIINNPDFYKFYLYFLKFYF